MSLGEILGNIFWWLLMGLILTWAYDMLKPYFRK
jgi:phosphatidylglycerophosphatase A